MGPRAMLDTRAEVNVITRSAAEELGLPITDLFLTLKAVSGDTRVFDGACEDIEIDIGGVVNYQTLLVLNNSEHTLIHEAPFSMMPALRSSTMRTVTSTLRYSVRIGIKLLPFGFVFHRISRAERTLNLRKTSSQYACKAAYWPENEVLEEACSIRGAAFLARRTKYCSGQEDKDCEANWCHPGLSAENHPKHGQRSQYWRV
jgi:hypothetical protein